MKKINEWPGRFISLCVSMVFVTFMYGQHITPSLISSGSLSMHEGTIGEAFTTPISNGQYLITQGFHQGMVITSNIDEALAHLEMNIFPNPFTSAINI